MVVNNNMIGVDVDGVLLDFLPGFERVASEVLGRKIIRQSTHWNLDLAYGITKEEHDAIWSASLEKKLFLDLPMMDGAFQAVQLLKQAGYDVHAVTAISQKHLPHRIENLKSHGFDVDHVHASGSGSKVHVLKELMPIMFVDDQQKYLHDALFIPNRVWIRNDCEQFPIHGGSHTHEAHNLLEFVEHWLEDRHHILKKN